MKETILIVDDEPSTLYHCRRLNYPLEKKGVIAPFFLVSIFCFLPYQMFFLMPFQPKISSL